VREKTGHALAGARQRIPAQDIKDPVKSLLTGLPLDLRSRTKGQLATPPADLGLIPLTVREVKRLLAVALHRPTPPGHAARSPD
jgi:hypothetical protein